MDNIYENFELNKTDSSENCHSPTERKTEDDVYVNAQEQCQTAKKCHATSSFDYKIIIFALTLLMLGALMSLCAVGILYHNNVIPTEILNEKYKNATAMLMVLEHKANEKESTYEMQMVKNQEIISACNKTDRLYKELMPKHQELISTCSGKKSTYVRKKQKVKEKERVYKELRVKHPELVSVCSVTEQLYEMVKVKYQRVHERLSACRANQKCTLCEEGWKSLGLKCYYFTTDKLNWEQSRDYCVGKGGHLVIITSKAEQDFVSSQIGETHWIGLNDLETEGKWMWVNNQLLKETGVTFWFNAPEGPHEPDNWKIEDPSGENCAALGNEASYTEKWFDDSCSKIKNCVCEK